MTNPLYLDVTLKAEGTFSQSVPGSLDETYLFVEKFTA